MSRFLYRLGATAARLHWVFIAVWVLAAAGAFTAGSPPGAVNRRSALLPGSTRHNSDPGAGQQTSAAACAGWQA